MITKLKEVCYTAINSGTELLQTLMWKEQRNCALWLLSRMYMV